MGSLKALFESYQSIHDEQLPPDLDMELMLKLLSLLLTNDHYVVRAYTSCHSMAITRRAGAAVHVALAVRVHRRVPAHPALHGHW